MHFVFCFFFEIVPHIVQSPVNANILLGSNHAFFCEGIGSDLDWTIDGVPIRDHENGPQLNLTLNHDSAKSDSCIQQSTLTVHVGSAPEDHFSSTSFVPVHVIQCVIQTADVIYPAIFQAYLNVHGKFICCM